MSKYIQVGIDPGPREHSFVRLNWQLMRVEAVQTLVTCEAVEYIKALRQLEISVAIEWVTSYGMPVGVEVFETVFAIGRMWQPGVRLIPRADIKQVLCGSGTAKDANIRQALIDFIGPKGTKKQPGPTYGVATHDWAALAVATVAASIERTNREASHFPTELPASLQPQKD